MKHSPEILLKDISKREGKRVLIGNLTLNVKDKEFLSLLGPPGSGKSNVLRLIAGLDHPDDGEISIDGKVVNELPPVERKVSMMFQSLALFPHLTVFENLAFPLRKEKPVDEGKISQRVNEIAELLKIGHLLERKPAQLSGGERQRVSLGRALVPGSTVVLLDEPLGHLDAKLRVYARSEIKKIQRQLGQTVIMSTVDAVDALAVSDRVGLMHQGEIVQLDTPAGIFQNPINLFVATSVGFPPLNVVAARLKQVDSKLILESEGFSLEVNKLKTLLSGRVGQELKLGIRPGDLSVSTDSEGIKGKVEIVEPLGPESILTLQVDGTTLTAKVPAGVALGVAGKVVSVHMPVDKILLFDSKGENLLYKGSP